MIPLDLDARLKLVPETVVPRRAIVHEPFKRLLLREEGLLRSGIYLREREISYFEVEDWPGMELTCVPFEGEIPCLYLVRSMPVAGPAVAAKVTLDFLSVVDFVFRTTGAGVGVALKKAPSSQLSTDLKTGRRVRYRVDKFPGKGAQKVDLYWVERVETGRGRGPIDAA
jgi:hypothetical protein